MSAAPPTDHEELRLATLAAQQILDTGQDKRFDNLVRLAADMFGVPIALICLVDRERQWFKAKVGLDVHETHRDHAFCAHAIHRPDEVLLVQDATRDPRFADNPLVLGAPGIRFYAGAPFRASNGEPLGTLCLIDTVPRTLKPAECERLRDLSRSVAAMVDLHRGVRELERAATHDPLTGLANRALFDSRLNAAMQDALAGRPFALLIADVTGFRHINQALSHDIGDAALLAVARRLTSSVRGADLVARIAGDEFGIILEGPVDNDTAATVARRITENVLPPLRIGGHSLSFGIHIGSAFCPLDAMDGRGLLRVADQALEAAKRGGRGQTLHGGLNNGLDVGLIEPAAPGQGRAMEAALRRALGDGALALHWQPYIDTATGAVRGFEALLRWTHPIHGEIGPAVFLPLAEATGLIAQLDTWVLRTACRAAAAWSGNYSIAVNLSAHWFSHGGVVDRVRQALSEFGLAPERLELELTERTVISSRDVARGQMTALRDMGVGMALDDFGTGYSSLAYLRQLPFEKLKLDRAFVAPLGEDSKADAVARAIIRLGHALEMQVCGEGVETLAQLAFLKREGCDLAQGYLLGCPAAIPCCDPFPIIAATAPQATNVVRLKERA